MKIVRVKFIVGVCIVAGIIELVVMGALYRRGLIADDEFPLSATLLWPILMVLIVPAVFHFASKRHESKSD